MKIIFKAYNLILDYVLLFFSPVIRILTTLLRNRVIDLVNSLYINRFDKESFQAHSSLEKFRNSYDLNDIDFFDRYFGKDWFNKKNVLDLGCFVGGKIDQYAKQGADKCIGIDLSTRGIEVANKASKSHAEFLNISSSDKNFKEKYGNSFDYIISFTVFEHIEEEYLLSVINDCYELLKKGGKAGIVYNFYYDRFGTHSNHFIAHPWPQILFGKKLYQAYCDERLRDAHSNNEMNYFPKGFSFSEDTDSDCHMGLNMLTPQQFELILKESKFSNWETAEYSRKRVVSKFYRFLPFLKIFTPSITYVMTK